MVCASYCICKRTEAGRYTDSIVECGQNVLASLRMPLALDSDRSDATLPTELRLCIDQHVRYIQSLDEVRQTPDHVRSDQALLTAW